VADDRAVPGVPQPAPFGEGADWEPRLFLWWAIRRVYATHKADPAAFPVVTAEGIAELRGITETLFSVTPLGHDAAVELLDPVVGRAIVDQWKKRKLAWG
jgi:hypothetical protein